MKKSILFLLLQVVVLCLFGCIGVNEKSEEKFVEMLSKSDCYTAEGVMETNLLEVSKECKFETLYSGDDKIKVILKDAQGSETQIIVKNSDGVYIVVPQVNKNYKIKSDFPESGNYPYLLTSLAKDIVNAGEIIETEDENQKTIEFNVNLPNNQKVSKEKIIFDKETDLPKEVMLLNDKNEVFIRVVFTKIGLNTKIDDKEFIVDDTINDVRATMKEEKDDDNQYIRSIRYPKYVPEGSKLSKEYTERSEDETTVISIMMYTGENCYTIVQEYVNDSKTVSSVQEYGTIDQIFGVPLVIKTQAVEGYYKGVKYTVASSDLTVEEMKKIIGSYFVEFEEK